MTPFAHSYHRSIPRIEGATTQVTYLLADVDAIRAIAEEVDAREGDAWDLPSLYEHHYEDDGIHPERWILVVRWKHDDVSYSAQSAATSTPSLVSA